MDEDNTVEVTAIQEVSICVYKGLSQSGIGYGVAVLLSCVEMSCECSCWC